MSLLLFATISVVIIAVLLTSKLPLSLWIVTRVLLTRFPETTFSYWKYNEYRHQNHQSKGTFSDKLFAKKYVESIYSDEMNVKWAKLLFVGVPTTDDLKRLRTLHKEFVIKANHGCKWNIMVKKDDHLKEQDMIEYIRKCSSWLKQTYGNSMFRSIFRANELHYRYIEPKVFIEEYLGDNLKDYKLHTINGKVEFVGVHSDRTTREANGQSAVANYYSPNP
eukprot:190915_1